MKTKNIFKALALAMLLTTACVNNEIPNENGYTLPVTINVTRQGDAATRATYTDNGDGTGSLAFSTGDQLYVEGSESSAGLFSGTLTWTSGGTFSGTITTTSEYSGTADELFTAAASNGYVQATLLPNGYGTYNFFGFKKGSLVREYDNAFATSKATAVEQFSYEFANTYSGGFTLAPQSAILDFTIAGLTANASNVAVFLTGGGYNISGTVDVDDKGNAAFAVGVPEYTDLSGRTLTVGGNAITLVSSSTSLTAGKVYNIYRDKTIPHVDLSKIDGSSYGVTGDVILTGTPVQSGFMISLPGEECTVTLVNVDPTGSKSVSLNGNSGIAMTVKLKGTSRLFELGNGSGASVTIDAVEPGGTVIVTKPMTPLSGGPLIINGGTVKAKATAAWYAVYGDLVVNGGAVYLAGHEYSSVDYPAVSGTITGTLYGWDGSAWGAVTSGTSSAAQYVTTDNTSGDPTAWTW